MTHHSIPDVSKRFNASHVPLETEFGGIAGECGSLTTFLTALKWGAVIWLMPLQRVGVIQGDLCYQRIIHLTARGPERDHPVYYASFPSSDITALGNYARIHFPFPAPRLPTPSALQRAQELQEELLECLIQALEADPRVTMLLVPARYRIPDAWAWGVRSSLEGSGIVFQDEHWQYQSAIRARPDAHSE